MVHQLEYSSLIQKPKKLHTEKDINNASKRVHELINKYGVKISKRTVEFYLEK